MKKITGKILLALSVGTSTAYAAAGQESAGPGFLTIAFLGFLAVIIAIQFIPGLILFFGLLRGIFSATEKKKVAPALGGKGDPLG